MEERRRQCCKQGTTKQLIGMSRAVGRTNAANDHLPRRFARWRRRTNNVIDYSLHADIANDADSADDAGDADGADDADAANDAHNEAVYIGLLSLLMMLIMVMFLLMMTTYSAEGLTARSLCHSGVPGEV